MVKTIYVSVSEINELQTRVMHFIMKWVHEKKTPVPYREVVINMQKQKVKEPTTVSALNSLLEKGYLRRASISSNKTFYVQLRTI